MKLFGQLVRTAVNVALLPVDIVKDAVTLGGTMTTQNPNFRNDRTYTAERLQKLVEDAEER